MSKTLSEDLATARLNAADFPGHVWGTLSRIDVSDHIEVVGNDKFSFRYLSWSWAWATLMNKFPESDFQVLPEETFQDGTMNVKVALTIRQGCLHLQREAWLPVMDRKNNAIVNPNARSINDARMRCLVKAMAFCGMGLDMWTGSDLPVGASEDPVSPDQLDLINGLIEKAEPDMIRFLKWMKVDTVDEIPQSKFKQAVNELERAIKRKSK